MRGGIVYGKAMLELFDRAKREGFAIPAVNVVNSHGACSVLEAAAKIGRPVILQLSHGGASFFAGKNPTLGSSESAKHHHAALGAKACATYVSQLAESYQVPVILHTDHAGRELLPWIDALIDINKSHFESFQRPLFSSHMLDLSDEPLAQNVETSVSYLQRFRPYELGLEMELGVTGGEEDGVDNTHVAKEALYTKPADVVYAYAKLGEVSPLFTIAASFGNVHGVYQPGNVKLTPEILRDSQAAVASRFGTSPNPVHFVFHGGSGSSSEEIQQAVSYGVVKMNLDTDLQWAFTEGVRHYFDQYQPFLQSQIGNPEGKDRPNKKYYDPRKWLREGEKQFVHRLTQAFRDLGHPV